MPVRSASTANVESATGRSAETWFVWLDRKKARDLPHKEIASLLAEQGVPGWWSQMLTVAYEQHIGRRVAGQDCTGKFRTSVSRTLEGDMDAGLARWTKAMNKRGEFSGVGVAGKAEVSKTPKWRYWRCRLEDGTRVSVNVSEAAAGKARIAVEHEKLDSSAAVDHWKASWKREIAAI